jgi:hypothetical protein
MARRESSCFRLTAQIHPPHQELATSRTRSPKKERGSKQEARQKVESSRSHDQGKASGNSKMQVMMLVAIDYLMDYQPCRKTPYSL